MKKLVLGSMLLAILGAGTVMGQCTPDQNATAFLTPSPTAPLPTGNVGTPYAQVITVNVPADTSVDLSALIGFPFPAITVTVNNLTIGTATGLPPGITANYNPSNGTILGGARGCIDLSGTPTQGGQYAMSFPSNFSVVIPSTVPVIGGTTQVLPAPIPYNMEVTGGVGVADPKSNGFTMAQTLPNPATGWTVLRYKVATTSDVELEVFSLIGERVYRDAQTGVTGESSFRFNVGELTPGIYLYRLSDGEQSLTRKMVVQ